MTTAPIPDPGWPATVERTPVRPSRVGRLLARAAIVGALALSATACSNDDPSADDPSADDAPPSSNPSRRTTNDEAAVLADLLKNNYDSGGAAFSARVPLGSTNVTVDGQVDWQGGRGSATVTADSPGSDTAEVLFTGDTVIERPDGLRQALDAAQLPALDYAARPLDAENVPLDFVLTLVASAASDQRDNPVTLAQQSTWTGTEEIGDVTAHIFRLDRTRYWVEMESRRLLRLEANRAGSLVVTIDFDQWGPTNVELPPDGQVVDATKIPEIMASLES